MFGVADFWSSLAIMKNTAKKKNSSENTYQHTATIISVSTFHCVETIEEKLYRSEVPWKLTWSL